MNIVIKDFDVLRDFEENVCNFVTNIAFADDQEPVGGRTSAGTHCLWSRPGLVYTQDRY